MGDDLLCVLWIFLPAGLANGAPVLAARIHWRPLDQLNVPVDAGKTLRGKRLFGANKTWRGLLAGIVVATAVLTLQQLLARQISWFAHLSDPAQIDFIALPTLLVGPLFGIGALLGDMIESFFKRQLGIGPGQRWFPFDQIDYVIGAALAVLPFIQLSSGQYILLLAIWLVLHVVSVYIGWLLKIRDQPI
jgi:CDP-2,3-bis-(O-geranylgeranyl)-sn-glycerol synthase